MSRQCAHRWVARFDAGGMQALSERSSRPRSSPQSTPAAVGTRVLRERACSRRGQDWIGAELGMPARTVGRILRRHRVPRLAECDPLTGAQIRGSRTTATRYEQARPGELVHLDVKKIGRIPDGDGWRAYGRAERPATQRGLGYDYVHAAVDDHSRLASAEILPDEKGATSAAFLQRAADHSANQGIGRIERVITDNAWAYRALLRLPCHRRRARRRATVHPPALPLWQNGKVERFNRTLQTEWAYRQIFSSNTERAAALDPWLTSNNTRRRHTALGGLPPISRLSPTS